MRLWPARLRVRASQANGAGELFVLGPHSGVARATLAEIQASRGLFGLETDSASWANPAYGDYLATSVPAYRAVTARANAVRAAPLIVGQQGRDGTFERVPPNHPAQELLRRVNEWWTAADLLYVTEMYLSVWGSAYWFLEDAERGRAPSAIWPLRPDRVRIVPGPTRRDYIRGYIYEAGSGRVSLLPEEVVWFRYPNPVDEYAGLSPLASARLSLDMGRDAVKYNRAFFKNSAMPQDVVFVVQGPVSDEEVEGFYQRLEKRFKGPEKAHRPLIWDLSQGAEPKRLGLSQREMEFLGSLQFSVQEAARVWGVPPPMLMSEAQSTYNNVREARIQFYVETISQEWAFMEAEINEMLMPRFGGDLRAAFDTSAILPLQEAQGDLNRTDLEMVRAGVLTVNEYRAARHMTPVPWGDVWWASVTAAPINSEEAPSPGFGGLSFDGRARQKTVVRDGHTPERLAILSRAFDQRLRPLERAHETETRKLFARQRESVLRALRAGPKGVDGAFAALVKQEPGVPPITLFNPEEWREPFARIGASLAAKALTASAQLQAEDFNLTFDALDRTIGEWTKQRAVFWAERVNQETLALIDGEIQKLLGEIASGIAEGDSIELMADRLESVFQFNDRVRAVRIARTETLAAANQGHLTLYEQAGVPRKEWLTAIDGRERPAHHEANGQVRERGEPFLVGGESLQAPGIGGSAGNVINCVLPGNRIRATGLVAAMAARYSGPAIEIITERGHRLTVTPKHPILTSSGLVPAERLGPGDDVVSDLLPGQMSSAYQHIADEPARIEDVVAALVMIVGTGDRLVGRPTDFHGDGRFVDGDVDVMWADGYLRCACGTPGLQPIHDERPCGADVLQRALSGLGAFDKLLVGAKLAPHGAVGSSGEPRTLLRTGLAHTYLHGSRAVVSGHTVLGGTVLELAPDKIVGIFTFHFAGHVYDLQTRVGLYINGGVVQSNCRCVVLPVISETGAEPRSIRRDAAIPAPAA